MMWQIIPVAVLTVLALGCNLEPEVQQSRVLAWRNVGSWSGRGNSQTGSFIGETGTFRIRWETSSETPAAIGTFQLRVHTAFTGVPLEVAIDNRGVGQGVAYVQQEPRTFHLIIDSANLDWSFTVEEAAFGAVSAFEEAESPKAGIEKRMELAVVSSSLVRGPLP